MQCQTPEFVNVPFPQGRKNLVTQYIQLTSIFWVVHDDADPTPRPKVTKKYPRPM